MIPAEDGERDAGKRGAAPLPRPTNAPLLVWILLFHQRLGAAANCRPHLHYRRRVVARFQTVEDPLSQSARDSCHPLHLLYERNPT
jgi:hypothetical protein